MRVTIDRATWDTPKRFRAWHNHFLDTRKKLGKLPRLVVDRTDKNFEYQLYTRLGDFVAQRFSDATALSSAKSPAQQAVLAHYLLVLAYVKQEMLVSDSESWERISRILHETSKIKPIDGLDALYKAFSRALLKA
jgi:hypothetical protein